MNPIFKKLNFAGQAEMHMLNAPETFGGAIVDMTALTAVRRSLEPGGNTPFLLSFAMKQAEVEALAQQVADHTRGDVLVWGRTPRRAVNAGSANSTRTPAGPHWAPWGLSQCGRSQLMRTGRHCASAGDVHQENDASGRPGCTGAGTDWPQVSVLSAESLPCRHPVPKALWVISR